MDLKINNNQILISTVLSRLNGAINIAQNTYDSTGIGSLIVCQTYEQPRIQFRNYKCESHFIFYTPTKGLAKSRNIALEHSTAKYIWFLDDDVVVNAEGCKQAFSQLQENAGDVITTCYSLNTGKVKKNYRRHEFWHNKLSIMKVSSIEIMCNRTFLLENGIQFDQRFGLGTAYLAGEENIFLADCLNANARMKYIPIITSIHPEESTGGKLNDPSLLASKGAMIRRVYGLKGAPLLVAFFIKRLIRKEIGFKEMFIAIHIGIRGFVRLNSIQ